MPFINCLTSRFHQSMKNNLQLGPNGQQGKKNGGFHYFTTAGDNYDGSTFKQLPDVHLIICKKDVILYFPNKCGNFFCINILRNIRVLHRLCVICWMHFVYFTFSSRCLYTFLVFFFSFYNCYWLIVSREKDLCIFVDVSILRQLSLLCSDFFSQSLCESQLLDLKDLF